MMYSQQEYDMMRRQTLQIEAEKRAFLRSLLIITAALLALSLIIAGFLFRSYRESSALISAAEERRNTAEAQAQQCAEELSNKTTQLEKYEQQTAARNDRIAALLPRVLGRSASDTEVAALAHAIYETPGHMIELPSIPPDKILRRYRYRADGRLHAYILVAGKVDDRWRLYSNLVGTSSN